MQAARDQREDKSHYEYETSTHKPWNTYNSLEAPETQRECCLKHVKDSKERYLLGQKHNLQIFAVILVIKLQNDT